MPCFNGVYNIRKLKVKRTMIFPSVLMTLDIRAGLVHAWDGNWRKAIYWLAAATLTATVTF